MDTPAARLARRWATRHQRRARPEGILECGACGKTVEPGEGIWSLDARKIACDEECLHTVLADHYY